MRQFPLGQTADKFGLGYLAILLHILHSLSTERSDLLLHNFQILCQHDLLRFEIVFDDNFLVLDYGPAAVPSEFGDHPRFGQPYNQLYKLPVQQLNSLPIDIPKHLHQSLTNILVVQVNPLLLLLQKPDIDQIDQRQPRQFGYLMQHVHRMGTWVKWMSFPGQYDLGGGRGLGEWGEGIVGVLNIDEH